MANKRKKNAAPAAEKPQYLSGILKNTCIYYTVTTFLLIFLFWLVSDDITRAMHPVALMLVLPFSLFFAIANAVYRHAPLDTWVRVLCHYVITMLGIMLFLYLPNKAADAKPMGALLLLLALTVLYAIIMGVVLYLSGRMHRLSRDTSVYTSVYKNK